MKRELGNLWTGGIEACTVRTIGGMVHACKHPCHFSKCGQPAKVDADYLAHEEGEQLWLNIIDPDEPMFEVELFRRFLKWSIPRAARPMMIHCNEGQSRSRSLALLLLAATGKIDRRSYEAASKSFTALTGREYRPGRGLGDFLDANWQDILAGFTPAEQAPAPVNAWTKAVEQGAPEPTPPKPPTQAELTKCGYTLQEFNRIASDPELWARMHGKVLDRVTQDPIDYIPSILQRRMFAYYRYCQGRGIPCRMVVVKIRRGGGSTGAQAILYVHVHNYKARVGTVGTNDVVSMNMFKMIRAFDENDTLPWARATKILETGHLAWPNGSTWEKYTAENPEAARSAGLQAYAGTECGRWPDGGAKDAKETLKSMLGAVPRRGFTVCIEESTAQGGTGAFASRFAAGRWPTAEELSCGVGEEFWRKWEDETPQNIAATAAERALQFVRIGAAWFEDEENRAEVTPADEERIMATLTEKETELVRRYQEEGPKGKRLGSYANARTVEQLAWRRAVIETEFEGDIEGFEQENPSSPKEAFASSGRHTFNRAGCAWMLATARQRAPMLGVLQKQQNGSVTFRRTPANEAWLMVWEEPRVGHRYVEGVDTCGGKSNQRTDTPDYNAAGVMRTAYRDETGLKHARRIVAEITAKNLFDPDVLAEKTHLLSLWYGGCLVVFEVNNTGAAYRQEAKRLGMNLYREQVVDKYSSVTTEYIGWTTTAESREQLIGALKKAVRNNAAAETRPDGIEIWSETTAREFDDMIRNDQAKDEAPSGKHDDNVMYVGMCIQGEQGATYYAERKRSRQGPADRGEGGWQHALPGA